MPYVVVFASAFLFGIPGRAGVIYDESVSGDLSNSGLTPTLLTVSLGSNEVFGTTGGTTTAVDRDYFTFTVPTGLVLSSIVVLPGTQSLGPGGESFMGVQAGPQVTVNPGASDATGLLGWIHYEPADINTDILPEMGSDGLGSTGFVPPLPSGTYSFWVQEGNIGTAAYGFDFMTAAVPEPGSWAMLLMGLAVVGTYAAYKRRSAPRN